MTATHFRGHFIGRDRRPGGPALRTAVSFVPFVFFVFKSN
jgi:hypothetical protein